MKKLIFLLITFSFLLLLFTACNPEEQEKGSLSIKFDHRINDNKILFDTMLYVNEAGNNYEVNEIQYFISEVELISENGERFFINTNGGIHYVDIDIPETCEWICSNEIPANNYDSISFVFGLSEENNISYRFVNPPERDMFWPQNLGGGYHYMKLNCKYKNLDGLVNNGNFHLGIAKKDENTFEHYYFKVKLPLNISINNNNQRVLLVMNVEEWFKNPNLWDWNIIGGAIMSNADAIKSACQNGKDVFSIEIIEQVIL